MAHIDETPSGYNPKTGKYRVRWRDPDGKHREKWVKGKKAAKAEVAQLNNALATNTYVAQPKKTLQAVTEEFLAHLPTKPRKKPIKPETIEEYRRLLETKAHNFFGPNRAIGTIKRKDARLFAQSLSSNVQRRETAVRGFAPFKALCRFAVAEGYLPSNPTQDVAPPEPPDPNEFEAKFLTWPEVEQIAERVSSKVHWYGLLVRLAASTGLRASEISNLERRDIVIVQHGTIRVRKGKSENAIRTVPLRKELASDLAEYLSQHPNPLPQGRVFYGRYPSTGVPDHSRPLNMREFHRSVFGPASRTVVEGGCRFHDLRHTAVSLWGAAGIEWHKVRQWIGHGSLEVTRIYAHYFPQDHQQDMGRLDALIAQQQADATPRGVVAGFPHSLPAPQQVAP